MSKTGLMEGSWPQIQIALDLVRLTDALRIAKIAASEGINWIEAGTPLIKSVGMEGVRVLRKRFPSKTVVADMKTLDAGSIESEMAFDAGASVVSISGLAHDSTVRDAVKICAKYDGTLMADLLMSVNPHRRARQLETLGVDIVCVHTGIDAQRAQGSRVKVDQKLRRIVRALDVPVAAAGGINPETAKTLVRAGVSLLIVGNWITGSKSPERAAGRLVRSVGSFQDP